MSGVPAAVRRARGVVVEGAAWAAGALFAVIFAINVAQIAARQLNGGWIWVSDLSRLLFAWTVMLGAAAAYGRHEHIVASFLVEKVPDRWRWVPALLVRVVEVLVALLLLLAGLQVAGTRGQIDYIQLAGVSTGLAYLAVPALGALMLLFALTSPLTPATAAERVEHETRLGGARREETP